MESIDFNATGTYFLPAKRSSKEFVIAQNQKLSGSPMLEEVFSKIPLMFQILNEDRQVVYMNSKLKEEMENKGIEHEYAYRTGEIFNCPNAFTQTGGCGTSENCQYCNIISSIIKSKEQKSPYTQEAYLISNMRGKSEMYNYKVSSIPFTLQDENFIMLTFENISDNKRKEQLERTFFHDLLNKVSFVSGLSELLEMEAYDENNNLIKMIKRSIYDLTDEINFQRNILRAERNELVLSNSNMFSFDILQQMAENFLPYHASFKKNVVIDTTSTNVFFKSDPVLVKRILTNLIKNAIEAIKTSGTVNIGSKAEGNKVVFWVHNDVVLPNDIKAKIFNRFFSTKGEGRGIGTYSVKLFTEKYLKGKAYFISEQEKGTIFYVEFPLD